MSDVARCIIASKTFLGYSVVCKSQAKVAFTCNVCQVCEWKSGRGQQCAQLFTFFYFFIYTKETSSDTCLVFIDAPVTVILVIIIIILIIIVHHQINIFQQHIQG